MTMTLSAAPASTGRRIDITYLLNAPAEENNPQTSYSPNTSHCRTPSTSSYASGLSPSPRIGVDSPDTPISSRESSFDCYHHDTTNSQAGTVEEERHQFQSSFCRPPPVSSPPDRQLPHRARGASQPYAWATNRVSRIRKRRASPLQSSHGSTLPPIASRQPPYQQQTTLPPIIQHSPPSSSSSIIHRDSRTPPRSNSNHTARERREFRPTYEQEEELFIAYHRMDLALDWSSVKDAYNQQFPNRQRKGFQGIQCKYYRYCDNMGIPKVRERARNSARKSAAANAGNSTTQANAIEDVNKGYGVRDRFPDTWYSWMRGPKPEGLVVRDEQMLDAQPM